MIERTNRNALTYILIFQVEEKKKGSKIHFVSKGYNRNINSPNIWWKNLLKVIENKFTSTIMIHIIYVLIFDKKEKDSIIFQQWKSKI